MTQPLDAQVMYIAVPRNAAFAQRQQHLKCAHVPYVAREYAVRQDCKSLSTHVGARALIDHDGVLHFCWRLTNHRRVHAAYELAVQGVIASTTCGQGESDLWLLHSLNWCLQAQHISITSSD
jgi:hypothetical protein